MTDKVNGHVAAGEVVGGDVQFFTVTLTGANFTDAAATTVDAGRKILDVAVEVIQGFETPVILSVTSATVIKFATNRVASFKEAKDTGDTKQATLATVLGAALTAVKGSAVTAVVDKADTL